MLSAVAGILPFDGRKTESSSSGLSVLLGRIPGMRGREGSLLPTLSPLPVPNPLDEPSTSSDPEDPVADKKVKRSKV